MNNLQFKWVSTTPEIQWEDIRTDFAKSGEDTLELTGKRYQVIDGFGGCFNELGWIALSHLNEREKDKVISELFDQKTGCKFSLCRLPVGANDYSAEWYSYNENDGDYSMEKFSIERDRSYLMPYIKKAMHLKHDLKLFASPWSPPTWMKFPKAHNYGTLIWEKRMLEVYAIYFLKFIKAYRAEGININQIHIQNEPFSSQKFPSCKWTGEQYREFIRDYIGPLFEKENISTEIWFGTLNGEFADYDLFVDTVLSDPEARKYITGVGFQWAGKELIQRVYESWPELCLMQTENECGDGKNTWEYARYIYSLMKHYFTNGAGSYVYWNMILEPGGESTWGWKQNSMITIDPDTKKVIYNPEFYVIKHFSHFIAPGAVRLGITGHWSGTSLAFKNPDGSIILIVGNGIGRSRPFTFKGIDKHFSVNLKPYSINSIVLNICK